MAVKIFDDLAFRALGFATKNIETDRFTIYELEGSGEISVWKIGEWLQFRLNICDEKSSVSYSVQLALWETVNRIHDLALGARVVVANGGRITIVSDLLQSNITDQAAAIFANQIFFLSDIVFQVVRLIEERGSGLSDDEIENLFEI